MTLVIKNGRLLGAPFVNANASGGSLKPSLIIVHDTAGRLEKGSSVNWLKSKACTVSAHFVVERDGTIVQMVPTDKRAFHAGQSQWGGRKQCNSFSLGIEIVNPGKLDGDGRAWFHKDDRGRAREPGFPLAGLERAATAEHGSGLWMPYTPAQISAVKELCRTLVAAFPDCNEIVTHWQVSPGRKVDTSPLFPLDEVRDYAFGRVEPETLDVPDVAIQPAERPVESMAQSTEGNAALVSGGLGTLQVAQELSGAMTKVAASGRGFSAGEFVLQLTTSVTFWAAVLSIALAGYLWFRRRTRLITQGV